MSDFGDETGAELLNDLKRSFEKLAARIWESWKSGHWDSIMESFGKMLAGGSAPSDVEAHSLSESLNASGIRNVTLSDGLTTLAFDPSTGRMYRGVDLSADAFAETVESAVAAFAAPIPADAAVNPRELAERTAAALTSLGYPVRASGTSIVGDAETMGKALSTRKGRKAWADALAKSSMELLDSLEKEPERKASRSLEPQAEIRLRPVLYHEDPATPAQARAISDIVAEGGLADVDLDMRKLTAGEARGLLNRFVTPPRGALPHLEPNMPASGAQVAALEELLFSGALAPEEYAVFGSDGTAGAAKALYDAHSDVPWPDLAPDEPTPYRDACAPTDPDSRSGRVEHSDIAARDADATPESAPAPTRNPNGKQARPGVARVEPGARYVSIPGPGGTEVEVDRCTVDGMSRYTISPAQSAGLVSEKSPSTLRPKSAELGKLHAGTEKQPLPSR